MSDPEWLDLINERGELASQMEADIPGMLQSGDLDLSLVQRLYSVLEQHIDALEQLIEAAEENGVPDDALDQAETIQERLVDLHGEVGKRLIRMGGDLKRH